MNAQANAARTLADFSALLQGVVDAIDAVVFHLEQEAAGHLRLGGARIEKRGGSMGVKALRHTVVGLHRSLNVFFVDTDGNAQQHLLGAFGNFAVGAQKVGALQGLEPKVVVVEIAVVNGRRIQQFAVGFDDFHHVISNQWRLQSRFGADVLVQIPHRLREGLVGVLVQVGYSDTCGQEGEVWVAHRHRGGRLSGKTVQLRGGYPVVKTLDNTHGYGHGVY